MKDQLSAVLESAPAGVKKRWKGPSNGWSVHLARWLPGMIVAGILFLLWAVMGEHFLPVLEVPVENVVTVRVDPSEGVEAPGREGPLVWEGDLLFQASGWIEPDPFPIRVTALQSGVVEEVVVLEGELVEAGQVIARLIEDDVRLHLEEAEADFKVAESAVEAARLRVAAARSAEMGLVARVRAAELRGEELEDLVNRLEAPDPGVFSERQLAQAKLQWESQKAEIDALRAALAGSGIGVQEAEEAVVEERARLERTRVRRERQELAKDRLEVRAPLAGRVMELYAAPGKKRMLAMDDLESATIAKLYDPEKLQARIDVPLEQAAGLQRGQAVRIRLPLLPERMFRGVVTRIVGMADISRNTLQVKVGIMDPDDALRPEMLCRAEFLGTMTGRDGSGLPSGGVESRAGVKVFAPVSSLVEREGREARVWTLDDSRERLERRSVALGAETDDGYIEVRSGLNPGDRVVVNPASDLRPGIKVKAVEAEGNK